MAESSSVRLLQHHLRQAGASLAAREFDAASTHLDAALAIDPASLAALTLRDRLIAQRSQLHHLTPPPPQPSTARASGSQQRFVPAGVNAASWLDFEQRIQERRFRALIEAADRAVAGGDGTAARAAVEEARELKPDSGEVARLAARIALLQIPAASHARESFFHSRTFRAASLLLLGVTLLMGLDWVRSNPAGSDGARQMASASVDAAPPVIENPASAPDVPVQGTSGISPERLPLTYRSIVTPSTTAPIAEPSPVVERAAVSAETPNSFVAVSSIRPVATPPIIGGEVPDDYVAPQREPARRTVVERDPAATTVPARPSTAAAPLANVFRQPSPIIESLSVPAPPPLSSAPPSPASAAPALAAVIAPAAVSEDTRVTAVLHQYASAYGQLNAAAVRSIWPSVDERALERAFSNLSSQSMSFDNCDITVTGPTARASCRGRASYVARVGSRERHNEPRTVRFELKREGDAWKIMKAETSR